MLHFYHVSTRIKYNIKLFRQISYFSIIWNSNLYYRGSPHTLTLLESDSRPNLYFIFHLIFNDFYRRMCEESRQFIKFGYTNMASLTFLRLQHNPVDSFKRLRLLLHEHSHCLRVCGVHHSYSEQYLLSYVIPNIWR